MAYAFGVLTSWPVIAPPGSLSVRYILEGSFAIALALRNLLHSENEVIVFGIIQIVPVTIIKSLFKNVSKEKIRNQLHDDGRKFCPILRLALFHFNRWKRFPELSSEICLVSLFFSFLRENGMPVASCQDRRFP